MEKTAVHMTIDQDRVTDCLVLILFFAEMNETKEPSYSRTFKLLEIFHRPRSG